MLYTSKMARRNIQDISAHYYGFCETEIDLHRVRHLELDQPRYQVLKLLTGRTDEKYAEQNRTEQKRTEQKRTGQNKTEEDRTEQYRREEMSRIGQGKTGLRYGARASLTADPTSGRVGQGRAFE
jgi:hypothetical protein